MRIVLQSCILFFFSTVPLAAQNEDLREEQIESFKRKATLIPPSPENSLHIIEAVDGMMRAIRERDMSRAYFAFTSKEFRRVTSLSSFTQFVKGSPVLEKNKSLSTTKVLTYENHAVYYAVGIAQDGTVSPIKYDLIIENGNWKILGIQLNVKP